MIYVILRIVLSCHVSGPEEAGKKLSVDLHGTMQALNRSNKLFREKSLDFEKSIKSYEVEIMNLEEERNEVLREVSSLKSKLQANEIQQANTGVDRFSNLESQLAETRLQLNLAQSERDEYEIAVEYVTNNVTTSKRSLQNHSPSSLSSSNSSNSRALDGVGSLRTEGGSWYQVDTYK